MNEKMTFGQWLDNFWYHNKWKTIFVAFVVMVIVICLMQMTTTQHFDAKILYAGPHIFTAEEKAAVEEAFSQILQSDYNEDGVKNAQLADLTLLSTEQYAEILQTIKEPADLIKYNQYAEDVRGDSFTQEITAGENIICLLDPHWYGIIKERGGLVPLSDLLGKTPENALDDYGIRLKDTDFAKYFAAFDPLPEDTILCFRVLSVVNGGKEAEKQHEDHKEIFKGAVNFILPQGFVTRPPVTEVPKDNKETQT